MPKSPGTWGVAAGHSVGLGPTSRFRMARLQAGVLAVLALAGVPICAVRRAGAWAGHMIRAAIVFDEVVGMAVDTLHVRRHAAADRSCLAFMLFRFFDILKPTPVREVERLPHGWGIMADDLVGGRLCESRPVADCLACCGRSPEVSPPDLNRRAQSPSGVPYAAGTDCL